MLYGNTAPDAELVVLYGNCQIPYLAQQLSAADLQGRGYLCVLNHPEPGGSIQFPPAAALDRCIAYLEQYEYQPLHPVREHLRAQLLPRTPRVAFPPLVFYALWPFDVLDTPGVRSERFPWGRYPMGDSVANEVAALNLAPDAALERYLGLSSERMPDLLQRLDADLARIEHRDQACDVTIADHIRTHFRDRHLFWTTAHCSVELIAELGRRLHTHCLDLFGGDRVKGREAMRQALQGIDGIGDIQVPIHPAVARTLELSFLPPDHRYRWYNQRWTHDEYFRHYLTRDESW